MDTESCAQCLHIQLEISNEWCPSGSDCCSLMSMSMTQTVRLSTASTNVQTTPSQLVQLTPTGQDAIQKDLSKLKNCGHRHPMWFKKTKYKVLNLGQGNPSTNTGCG